MRYAVIMAGGSGTRLWPMSRRRMPKQLVPFCDGRSLLQLAWERLEGLVEADRICICAAEAHRDAILKALPRMDPDLYIGEPMGRDTLNAVGLSATVLAKRDPDAVLAAVTADHVIGPVDAFRGYLDRGFTAVERSRRTMATFGITPTGPATGFGYLALGQSLSDGMVEVREFKEKPEAPLAIEYFDAGPERYLWNSGMFVWHVQTLLDTIGRYEPETSAGLQRIADAWDTEARMAVLAATYPGLRKISVDYAIMERASRDPAYRIVAVPALLDWLDVGNWASFALTCPADESDNRLHAAAAIFHKCRKTLAASTDPNHLIAAVGCEGLVIVHTHDATLVCPAEMAEEVKYLTGLIERTLGTEVL